VEGDDLVYESFGDAVVGGVNWALVQLTIKQSHSRRSSIRVIIP